MSAPDRYHFDPADPTPAVAGMSKLLGIPRKTGERVLTGRNDVLTFLGEPLPDDLEMIGVATAGLQVTSSLAHTDFYLQISDVGPKGKIRHVTHALRRLDAGQSIDELVKIELAPAAYRFKRGHRIRVQVSSGAHPRWNRNLGKANRRQRRPPCASPSSRSVTSRDARPSFICRSCKAPGIDSDVLRRCADRPRPNASSRSAERHSRLPGQQLGNAKRRNAIRVGEHVESGDAAGNDVKGH
jgi:hypothetical protein